MPLEAYYLKLISGQRHGPWAALQRAALWLLSKPYLRWRAASQTCLLKN